MKTTTTKIYQRGAGNAFARSSFAFGFCVCLLCFSQTSHAAITITGDVDMDDPGLYTLGFMMYVGSTGNGILEITDGSVADVGTSYLGYLPESTGVVTVNGVGSEWINEFTPFVGYSGDGTLNIANGGTVDCMDIIVGANEGSQGTITINGANSTLLTWDRNHYIGREGQGILNITDGGLACFQAFLTIDEDGDGDSFIDMATGGMLALGGDLGDSLHDFLGRIEGTKAIRYWDESSLSWADITDASYDDDYTLTYMADGDLSGYTVLTVTTPVPEPSSFVGLLGLCLAGLLARRRRM